MNSSRPGLVLSVDYGQRWPLSDIMWSGPRPEWDQVLSADLIARLKEWATFFNEHADYETGTFGSEERRKWFDLEGVRLFNELQKVIGDRYALTLNLWF
jgi:hypothetical protein